MARRLLEPWSRMRLTSRKTRRLARAARAGFTLIELSIVVAIIGVLAVIAVVGYRKLTLNAKISEARNVIGAIRIAQEDYKTERGIYANLGANPCPSTGLVVPIIKTQWNNACSGGAATWATLPVHVDGPVQFGYNTEAGIGPGMPGYGFVNTAAADPTKPWYAIQAVADLDGLGPPNTKLSGNSATNQIFSDQTSEGL